MFGSASPTRGSVAPHTPRAVRGLHERALGLGEENESDARRCAASQARSTRDRGTVRVGLQQRTAARLSEGARADTSPERPSDGEHRIAKLTEALAKVGWSGCSGGQWIHAQTCAIYSQEFCNETTSQCDCIDDDYPDTTLLPRDPTYGCGFIRDLPQDPTGAWISFGGGTLAFDRQTGLAWFNAEIFTDNAAYVNFDSYTPPAPATLNELIAYCGSLNVYGLTGWRVPTIDEVKLLTAGCAHLGSGPCQLSDPACLSSSCNCDANLCPIDGGPDDYRLYCRPNTHGDCGGMYTTSLCPDCPAPNVMWSFWSLYGTYRVVDPNSAAANYCVREVAF